MTIKQTLCKLVATATLASTLALSTIGCAGQNRTNLYRFYHNNIPCDGVMIESSKKVENSILPMTIHYNIGMDWSKKIKGYIKTDYQKVPTDVSIDVDVDIINRNGDLNITPEYGVAIHDQQDNTQIGHIISEIGAKIYTGGDEYGSLDFYLNGGVLATIIYEGKNHRFEVENKKATFVIPGGNASADFFSSLSVHLNIIEFINFQNEIILDDDGDFGYRFGIGGNW